VDERTALAATGTAFESYRSLVEEERRLLARAQPGSALRLA